MNAIRSLASAMVSLAILAVPGWAADVRLIKFSQALERPPGMVFSHFAKKVAIDGADIIVLATHAGGQSALLYQRASGSSRFTYRKTLLTFPYARERLQVRMKNGIAVVHFEDRAWILERIGGTYVLGQTDTSLRHPGGIAISGNSILFGGDNCDYDGVVYQKAGDGRWRITGRLDDNQGQCVPEGIAVELYGDTALLHAPATQEVTTWRRNGTALDWISAGNMEINSEVAASSGPFALRNSTAVTPGSYVFRLEGNTWIERGRVVPADHGMGSGSAREVKYRDGVLLTTEPWLPNYAPRPYVYLETAPGYFEHVAVLDVFTHTIDYDISGRTVVAAQYCCTDQQSAIIFVLPDPLAAPAMIPADFEDVDASDFAVVSGRFAIAERGSNQVLAQTDTRDLSLALAEESEGTYYQRIEADIAPASGATAGWVGLVARYVDANNFYYFAVRNDGTAGLYRRLQGADTLLANWSSARPRRVGLTVNDDEVRVVLDEQFSGFVRDRSLPRGRAGLATFRATADFDNVHIAAAGQTTLLAKRFVPDADIPADPIGREFNRIGGNWQYRETFPGYIEGYQQRDASRSAFAYLGASVRNQEIEVAFRINGVTSHTNAWVGMLGRYVDARTHYYALLRTLGRLEIRKKVDGVDTLLGSTNYTVSSGAYHMLRFRLVEDQLQLSAGDEVTGYQLILSVHDDAIPEGAHGLATHLAAATWDYMYVRQP